MPSRGGALAAKLVVPAHITDEDLAETISLLKMQGVRGMILALSPLGFKGEGALAKALQMDGVIWAANPAEMPAPLARSATCRPVLVCPQFGAAQIAEASSNALRSAAALALSCTGDVATFRRLGPTPFKLRFRRDPYPVFSPVRAATLVCLTKEDIQGAPHYNTPVGQKPPAEYMLDICQALLQKRYLLEIGLLAKASIVLGATLLCAATARTLPRLCLLLAISLVLFLAALTLRLSLPLGTVCCGYVLASLFHHFNGLASPTRLLASRSAWRKAGS